MFRLGFLCVCCFALGWRCLPSLAEEVDLNDLETRSAKSAVSTYQRKVESAKKVYEKEISAAEKDYAELIDKERNKLIEELEAALKKETSSGNLEEAIKLKDAIASLKSQTSTPNQQSGQLLGFWKIQYNDGAVRFNQFLLQNGQPAVVRYVNPRDKSSDKGTVMIQDGTVVVKYERYPAVERFNLNGERLFVEHWTVSGDSSIDRYPNLLGIATKVDPQSEK